MASSSIPGAERVSAGPHVVLAAHREDHPHPALVRSWLDTLLAGDEPFAVPARVWAWFLRLTTNRRILVVPTPRPEAFAVVVAVLAQPLHLALAPGLARFPLVHHRRPAGS